MRRWRAPGSRRSTSRLSPLPFAGRGWGERWRKCAAWAFLPPSLRARPRDRVRRTRGGMGDVGTRRRCRARGCSALAAFHASARPRLAPCPPGNADYPPFYQDAGLFERAIAKVADYPPSNEKLTGITVPHHLLADRLVALGFQAASGFSYKRIVILTPDHFRKADKPFATTRARLRDVRRQGRRPTQPRSRSCCGRRLDRRVLPVRPGSRHPRACCLS